MDDAGRGANTWGNLVAAIEYAPPHGAYRLSKDGEAAQWTTEMELTALLIERIDALRWENAGAPAGNKPKRIVRPGVKDETQRYGQGESWTPASFDLWWEMKGEELDS